MVDFRGLEERIVASGRVDGPQLEMLRQALYADGKIDRREADFLVVIHKRLPYRTEAFEKFFYKAIKDHILADGKISAAETAWLRQMLFQNGKIEDEERKFLNELRGEAEEVSPEFEQLLREVQKQPIEQHTSG